MQLVTAKRQQAKIKLSLAGSSGSGKTYSALLLAYGICNDWSKIAIIDTENFSASLYAHLGQFNVVNITEPFSPQKYCEAIKLCVDAGMEVIVIDSITHEWQGKGGCLDMHEKETAKMKIPNSFTAWSKITPLHQQFIDAILQSNCHIICTVRSKTEYILAERNGKQVPQKVGMAPITRDGFDFEVSISFDIDQNHKAFSTKDRTGLFQDKEPFVISENTGVMIKQWCEQGDIPIQSGIRPILEQVAECKTVEELLGLYNKQTPQIQQQHNSVFTEKRKQLMVTVPNQSGHISQHLKSIPNGTGINA